MKITLLNRMLITFEGKISQRLNNYTRLLTQFHTIICHLFAYPPSPSGDDVICEQPLLY